MNTSAWMLRQDGIAFPCSVHLYAMGDDDMSSEAEVASFLIATKSKDIELSELILDVWMAMLIEYKVSYDATADDISNCIKTCLQNLPYRLQNSLKIEDYLKIHSSQNNYSSVDELYTFLDDVRKNIVGLQNRIKDSLNQQFCRVRYGGQYDTKSNNSEIWFRISSVGFNWSNTIYLFVSEIRRKYNIASITICRDWESDNSSFSTDHESDKFYKAKDGSIYYHMPISEFLSADHESNPVFATDWNSGIFHGMRTSLNNGSTFENIINCCPAQLPNPITFYRKRLLNSEFAVCASITNFSDISELNTRTKMKLSRFIRLIKSEYPEISNVELSCKPYENRRGNLVGFEMNAKLSSENQNIDGLEINFAATSSLDSTSDKILFRLFKREFEDYLKFSNTNY
mgnify:CR=1 FL=1